MFPNSKFDVTKLSFPKVLDKTDNTNKFSCDTVEIDEFIHKQAMGFQEQRLGVTYLFHCETELIGFATLCMDHISKHRIYVKDRLVKPISSYPGLLIGQLGVTEKYQHKGVGKYICDFCFDRALKLSQNVVGCRFLIVNALETAVDFYVNYGFTLAPKQEKQKLMFLDITKRKQQTKT
jgi:GNAT superfamily N-acetyltransferase